MEFERSQALDDLFSLVYEELRRLASLVRRNNVNATLNSTALVHEAWLKLQHSSHLAGTSPSHFKGIAGRAMRQVLVDEARRRASQKRGGEGVPVAFVLAEPIAATTSCDDELILLDRALDELALLNPRQARLVESRFFAGSTVAETAKMLGVSESAVDRDWRTAKAWLASRISQSSEA